MLFNTIQDLIKDRRWTPGAGLTAFDSARNYAGSDLSDWVLVVFRTRDSDCLAESNFETALDQLGGEQDGVVQVQRIGHWACGWVEQLAVHVSAVDKLEIARSILNALEDYPVLDDQDFSDREAEERSETFGYYRDDFLSELKKYLGTEADLDKRYGRRNVDQVLYCIYYDDCSYSGQENGWVDQEAIQRFCDSKYFDGVSETNRLARKLKGL